MLTNKEIARLLKDTAALIELTGGNEFRARAFGSAARTIERADESIQTLIENGRLAELRGIGSGLAAQIEEIYEHGTFDVYEDLLSAIPPGLGEILRVKGLGAKKVRRIWQDLGITTLEDLEAAAQIGRLADLPGFGDKTQENILKNIALLKRYGTRRRYDQALMLAQPLMLKIKEVESIDRAEYAGEMRRKLETVEKVEIVASAHVVNAACEALQSFWETSEEMSDGCRSLRGQLTDGLPLEIHVVLPSRYGLELWERTGSEVHVSQFRELLDVPSAAEEEDDIFADAGVPFIAPELRENMGEIEAARTGSLPDLISEDDLRGILHNHSTYSDGAHTLEEMTSAARGLGYSYYGVCDHSRSLTIANGLSIERVRRQQDDIRRINESNPPSFHVFSGTESDILLDGSLDYPDEVLAGFDFVVASVHSHFNMTREEATARIIRAVENPFTSILGHVTGRLLLRREGYPVDHEKIIDACADNGVAIEINANPRRLDLDWRWVPNATERGVLISINPDAHSIDELYYMQWGVAVARKGWLTAEQCLNAKSLDDFRGWLEVLRTRQGITHV